jgi:serine/threonine-protein kinase
MSVMIAAARDDVERPSRHRPDLPSDVERVVLRCLARSPVDRFPDAATLDRHLAACASSIEWDFERAAEWWRARLPSAREA